MLPQPRLHSIDSVLTNELTCWRYQPTVRQSVKAANESPTETHMTRKPQITHVDVQLISYVPDEWTVE
uniref:Uncharacterized protein n=1 Tax=Anguilla anguilla TaxID=7936 RepID=A0A0E9WFX0_ANGAN